MVDFEEHIISDSERLVISFAGADQLSFQFGKSLTRLGINHILMRDSTQRYHHDGVLGIGDQAKVVKYIRLKKLWGYKIKTTGVSSGAYAALLYGQLVPVEEIIVFSALTGRQADDFPKEDWQYIVDPAIVNDDIDLRYYFPKGPVPKVISFISDGDGTRLDKQMAERIGLMPVVIPGYTHSDLAKGIRDMGMFESLFR